jgi:hypothetical protein
MVWRETVHSFRARELDIPIERGTTMAGAVICIRIAAGAAVRDMAGKSYRAQEV